MQTACRLLYTGVVAVATLASHGCGGVIESPRSRLMATLPAGAVEGVTETLQVFENLHEPHAPILYRGETTRFEITKSAESITVQNETALWGGLQAHDVMHAEADVLGNELVRGGEPRFVDVARLLPPVLATKNVGLHTDYSLDAQSFVGSRIASEKRAFSATGAGTRPEVCSYSHHTVSSCSLRGLGAAFAMTACLLLHHDRALGRRKARVPFRHITAHSE
eukprot:COSAG02_NODE_48_length_45421_cov_103.222100_17_plen_222_part_00